MADALKLAMRERDKPRVAALRLIHAAIKQREVDERVELDDQAVLTVLNKMVKQHQDSISQFAAAGREDLVANERFELDLIREFLPAQLPEEAVRERVRAAVDSTGAQSLKDMGKVMAALKPELQGQADMAQVSVMVRQLLQH